MTTQPELSVKDFFALGNAAADHTASLAVRYPPQVAVRQPEDAIKEAGQPAEPGNAAAV